MRKWRAFVAVLLIAALVAGTALADLEIPKELTVIAESTFENDAQLTGVWVGQEGLTEIGANAFSGTNLFAMDLPESLTKLGKQKLKKAVYIRIRGKETSVDSLSGVKYVIAPAGSKAAEWAEKKGFPYVEEEGMEEYQGFFYQTNEEGWTLLSAVDPANLLESIEIPAFIKQKPVNQIESYAFMGCSSLKEINLPDTLEDKVQPDMFKDCPKAKVEYYHQDAPYPEPIPGIDFGGAEVMILDWWSGEGWLDPEEDTMWAYREWINSTYNVNLKRVSEGDWGSVDWGSIGSDMVNFAANPDGSLRIYIIPMDFVSNIIRTDSAAPLNGKYVNLNASKWNSAYSAFTTIAGKQYAVVPGKSDPRQCVFFNKRVLSEAGIDWNTLYDMQANGTWTWSAFENMLETVTRDTDGDGVNDIWGIVGSSDDLYRVAVFANGGAFFDFDASGKLEPVINSGRAVNALKWAQTIRSKYWAAQPEDTNWDWYKDFWKQGTTAFYMGQAWQGFNAGSEMSDMADEWGCVAFPVNNAGDTYVTIISDNLAMIPACYDEETVAKLLLLYDLWTNSQNGYTDSWIGGKLNYTDRRAVMETYAMLRKPAHGRVDKTNYLGSINDVLGPSVLWRLGGENPVAIIEDALPELQALCDQFNN